MHEEYVLKYVECRNKIKENYIFLNCNDFFDEAQKVWHLMICDYFRAPYISDAEELRYPRQFRTFQIKELILKKLEEIK